MAQTSSTSELLIREFQVPASTVSKGWLVGARSRLVDSWTPLPEIIQMQEVIFRSGFVRILVREGVSHLGSPRSRVGRFKWYVRGRHRAPAIYADRPVLDLRFDTARNFAHVFCWTGLYALAAKRALQEETGSDALMVVVPGDAKAFAIRTLELLGLTPIPTFGPVHGKIITVAESGPNRILQLASALLPDSLSTSLETGVPTPKKLFISRRDVRCIDNEHEIIGALCDRGFQHIYAEDFSVLEQMRHVTNASQIVAIHGAALGPIICRAIMHNRRPLSLLELFGSGYIVTLYRQIASILGDSWIGVRGRVTPEVVRDTDRAGLARAHDKSNFTVDPESLRIALDAIDHGSTPHYSVTR